jgi:hypothetical protein
VDAGCSPTSTFAGSENLVVVVGTSTALGGVMFTVVKDPCP